MRISCCTPYNGIKRPPLMLIFYNVALSIRNRSGPCNGVSLGTFLKIHWTTLLSRATVIARKKCSKRTTLNTVRRQRNFSGPQASKGGKWHEFQTISPKPDQDSSWLGATGRNRRASDH